ncbi:MAG: hypothetical protein JNL32_11160 [Candidatus Kapabacteria bacterium]|nr:hypothetical protein [Candidatus Kapabacteria bacterium]
MTTSQHCRFFGTILAVCLAFAGCAAPMKTIVSPYTEYEKITLGDMKLVVLKMSDTLASFSTQRYVPVYHFRVMNSSGAVVKTYTGAVQQYLSRIAGSLAADQKRVITSVQQSVVDTGSSNAMITWKVLKTNEDVTDTRGAVSAVKTTYWSLDEITADGSPTEVLIAHILSVPSSEQQLRPRRLTDDALQLLRDGDERAYYEMKRYLMNQHGGKR